MYAVFGTYYYPYVSAPKKSFHYTLKTSSEVVDLLNRVRYAAERGYYHTDISVKDDYSGVVIIGAI